MGKNPNIHFTLLSEASLYRGKMGIWEGEGEGEVPRGSTDLRFVLGGEAERGFTQLLPKLAHSVQVLSFLLVLEFLSSPTPVVNGLEVSVLSG